MVLCLVVVLLMMVLLNCIIKLTTSCLGHYINRPIDYFCMPQNVLESDNLIANKNLDSAVLGILLAFAPKSAWFTLENMPILQDRTRPP